MSCCADRVGEQRIPSVKRTGIQSMHGHEVAIEVAVVPEDLRERTSESDRVFEKRHNGSQCAYLQRTCL